ncbi:flavin-containing monooxygenase [Spirilliplanes yamanashiensis]|uniref:Flavin-binding monooxygenase n=1 Tax=Spirilliplanes yamanashiensis TaxID=42233 RepID=A0A8J4DJ37_9ACTN|nr:NAD(P)/FAD-dependent oxidoreductase [Spirilliplanes yamanashiensis]MDP9817499.1 cation diffusion facilitator CzcD-associated flavoprotein CzcO [Spirilliplanes yamanashiensis]GIJ02848.1 flavin-binding monooxygenase [Spirilliplanes yamanashiensis]
MTEHVDVLIVGAGLSGIGAACRLTLDRPGTTFAILEARDAPGGTWDLFRYPGVRSDSDMFTLGYAFRPWTAETSIADGATILDYIRATAAEHGVDTAVRYGERAVTAAWADGRWTVTTAAGTELTCTWLWLCTGYYRYDEGYTPPLPGVEAFAGPVVHPQHWPAGLDVTGRRVVVVGSGATAVTLVPALARRGAAHVTMLQRSPSYVLSMPARDRIAALLRARLSPERAYRLIRWKNTRTTGAFYRLSRRAPRLVRALLRRGARRQLPAGYPVDVHFAPRYDPWDQRLCLVPDGDLFRALSGGRASVVTDTIAGFDPGAVRLASGGAVDADVLVTATGLNLLAFGGLALTVDGAEVDVPGTVAYKGMMLSGVPNLSFTLGYTNASWTLKADLVAEHVCRLLAHLERTGAAVATPAAPPGGGTDPLIDLTSGYVLRSAARLPRQGRVTPWRLHQDYARDVRLLRHGPVDDEGLVFTPAPARVP